MAEQEETRSKYIISRVGKYWGVRNCNRWIGGNFTTLYSAERYVKFLEEDDRIAEEHRELREIKKIPDIKKRQREYKKLCQKIQSTQPLSQVE